MTSFVHVRMRQVLASFLMVACQSVGTVQASTVLQMGFDEVVDTASLIFEGTVQAVESREHADGSIHTYVTLQVQEIVKGQYPHEAIELRFLGGEVNGRRLEVSDMQLPVRGEVGIYFVETLTNTQVHPLVGWSQGHFLIAGEDRSVITTETGLPILSVSPEQATQSMSLSQGVAQGVQVQAQGQVFSLSRPMSPEDFKAAVRSIVAEEQ